MVSLCWVMHEWWEVHRALSHKTNVRSSSFCFKSTSPPSLNKRLKGHRSKPKLSSLPCAARYVILIPDLHVASTESPAWGATNVAVVYSGLQTVCGCVQSPIALYHFVFSATTRTEPFNLEDGLVTAFSLACMLGVQAYLRN